ncbi:phosphocholine cytidylyltransferase family protein [Rhizobium calliandrae]|uniref:Phosphocholine cytidylyltransferase family protein n=1 Tax=Rhizobium calliandrae TaxID=1312182 RepID=A0ABT7KIY4_9HYPH|nr:phosphocholine cytidylyltransferase family protein [Rhizobium calliandrae]MDL2408591.1 phosphocholine cytidylyltransferase family protein [Rhizobium calliandrae]
MSARSSAKRAIILAAGTGSRLLPLTELRPKPLVEVGGTPILFNALRCLRAIGVEEVTIVVGHRKDAIEYACGRQFDGVAVQYVESDCFGATGSAHSLWLAREYLLSGDCYVLEADIYFEEAALRRLAAHMADNVTAVASFDTAMEGSAVVLDELGSVAEYRLKQTAAGLLKIASPTYKTMNLSRFSRATSAELLLPALSGEIQSGKVGSYLEEILTRLVAEQGLIIEPVLCDGIRWYEIDTPEDLWRAEAIFAGIVGGTHCSRGSC